ncbi:MAG: global cell cycle regulator GcrA-like protein [Rhodospirillaceae bacterium]|nr:global cell cycle regulator GcrA-like protein [Rhodospirillaceae bacterium]
MEWTEARVDQLKQLWSDGLTASQIAEKLGGVSRNAVIGKAHRLGLSSRPSPIKRKTIQLNTVSERMCQWPIGDPGDAEFHFCGEPALHGRPYCAEHCATAYRRKSESAA